VVYIQPGYKHPSEDPTFEVSNKVRHTVCQLLHMAFCHMAAATCRTAGQGAGTSCVQRLNPALQKLGH
jgi:hypothetical protein